MMAFQLSPGVNVSEIDLTTIVPSVGSTEGAYVGHFNWGPANTIVGISDEVGLISTFGRPDTNTNVAESFFTAANFLAYANNLKIVRALPASARNASSNATLSLIANRDAYEAAYATMPISANGDYTSKYAGEYGNTLKVAVCGSANGFPFYAFSSYYASAPNTSTYAARVGGSADEFHITVVDEKGVFTGTANSVLETFGYVSKAYDAKNDDGSSNYYVNVLNDRSKYIYATAHPAANGWGNTASSTSFGNIGGANTRTYTLAGGVGANTSTDANIIGAYDKFKNADEIDISLILMGSHSSIVSKSIVDNIAEVRKDCMVFISPAKTDVINQVGSEVTNITTTRNTYNSSSYAFFDTGWKYQFDKYNNIYRWVPLNGDIAGLCVRTDYQRDPWFSPAGFNRGQIKNVTKLAWNPTKSQRDSLYNIGVNSVVSFQGEGTVLYGDKTMLSKPSAFDRINVRRLFIVLEKAIARASKYSLFEFNDEFTRAQFVSLIEPYLRDVQGRRGIFDFRVVCDTTNNTPEVIDRNEFVGDIYIKPARSINFIQLNFVAVRTGVAFEEIVGRF
jgi:hypothetical protein